MWHALPNHREGAFESYSSRTVTDLSCVFCLSSINGAQREAGQPYGYNFKSQPWFSLVNVRVEVCHASSHLTAFQRFDFLSLTLVAAALIPLQHSGMEVCNLQITLVILLEVELKCYWIIDFCYCCRPEALRLACWFNLKKRKEKENWGGGRTVEAI